MSYVIVSSKNLWDLSLALLAQRPDAEVSFLIIIFLNIFEIYFDGPPYGIIKPDSSGNIVMYILLLLVRLLRIVLSARLWLWCQFFLAFLFSFNQFIYFYRMFIVLFWILTEEFASVTVSSIKVDSELFSSLTLVDVLSLGIYHRIAVYGVGIYV